MGRNWEDDLRKWAQRPSNTEDAKRKRSEAQIHDALRVSPALKPFTYDVYAKGSYANNTNVRLDYDIDIAVQCLDFYFHDEVGAASKEKKEKVQALFQKHTGTGVNEFKTAIQSALQSAFGKSAVTPGKIAFRVREQKLTLPADVVPCFTYREIRDLDSHNKFVYREGTRIFPASGKHVSNWPKQQLALGTAKNEATGHRYKRLVRALKRLQTELVTESLLPDALASFLIECLVFNVPNDHFNQDRDHYVKDMRSVLARILNATKLESGCEDWVEVNDVKYLFHSSQPWKFEQAHQLALAAWKYMGLS
jgi:hypothetical protein